MQHWYVAIFVVLSPLIAEMPQQDSLVKLQVFPPKVVYFNVLSCSFPCSMRSMKKCKALY